jgi:opacity protein-like surface antigen
LNTTNDAREANSKAEPDGCIGVEYAIWGNISVKLEYLHADFGSSRYFSTPINLGALTVATRDIALKDDLLRAGLNWRFTSLP